jgi:hypothetical protein
MAENQVVTIFNVNQFNESLADDERTALELRCLHDPA